MKRKNLLASIIISIPLIIGGCQSANTAQADTSQADTPYQRFVEIDSSGFPGGHLFVDTHTNIEYLMYSDYKRGAAMVMLMDEDGKPLKYNAEIGE